MSVYAAAIVLYNPSIDRLRNNIDSILNQVDKVYCFDNGSVNINDVENLLNMYKEVGEKIVLIKSEVNEGISVALNIVAAKALNEKMEWLLTLDQDSVCPNGMIKEFIKYANDKKIGIISPVVIDVRRPFSDGFIFKNDIDEVDFCITSGSFVNLEIFTMIGGFDEYLFVGCIDNEYSYRLLLNGYKIIRVNKVVLDHEFGEIVTKKTADFWIRLGDVLKIKKIKSLSYERIISPTRFYYVARNYVYLGKKYKNYPSKNMKAIVGIYESCSAILRGENKIEIIKAVFTGLLAGYKKVVVPYKLERIEKV